jgi:diguanylate cyclase (GGDEF)-like protein
MESYHRHPDAYRIDRLTAEFVFPETEQAFQRFIRGDWVRDTRHAILLAALFYLMFAVTDYLLMAADPAYPLVLLNRVIVCSVGLAAALRGGRLWRHLVNGVISTLVVAIALAAFIANTVLVPLDYGVHGMGMMAMLWGVYVFIPNRYVNTLAVALPASVVFLLVVADHFGLTLGNLATLAALLVVTNVLGAMVARRTSVMLRRAYCDHAVYKAANERLEREAEERNRLEVELRRRANHDETTGVANRAAFFEAAGRLVGEAEAAGQPLALLLFDIDYFKQLNGTYGHMSSDEVLKALVSVCVALLPPTHLLGRVGGEEFAALLPATAQDEALRVAERIRAECQRTPVAIAEVAIHFTVCVGVAQRRPAELLTALLRRADEAVSAAKYKGLNRVEPAP